VTAPEQHDDDPQHDTESLVSAPQTAAESARAKELASLFGTSQAGVVQRSEAEEAARRDSLAALFARPANAAAAAAQPAFTWDPEAVAWDPQAVIAPEKVDAAPVGAAGVGVETAEPSAVSLPAAAGFADAADAAPADAAATGFAGVDAADAAPVGAAGVSAAVAGHRRAGIRAGSSRNRSPGVAGIHR